jgi:hypothetical protein
MRPLKILREGKISLLANDVYDKRGMTQLLTQLLTQFERTTYVKQD